MRNDRGCREVGNNRLCGHPDLYSRGNGAVDGNVVEGTAKMRDRHSENLGSRLRLGAGVDLGYSHSLAQAGDRSCSCGAMRIRSLDRESVGVLLVPAKMAAASSGRRRQRAAGTDYGESHRPYCDGKDIGLEEIPCLGHVEPWLSG